jgi:TRAP-type C4-dicarboxylate transport system permease small subunit
MKPTVKALNYFVFWGYKIIRPLAGISLLAIFISITVGIVSRYIFNSPVTWSEELCTFMMVNLCYLSAAITTARKKHIVADFLISKAPVKFQTVSKYFSSVLQLVFFVVLFYSIILLLPSIGWKSPVLNISRQAYYYVAAVATVYMFVTVVTDIVNDIVPGYDLVKKENEKLLRLEKEKMDAEKAKMEEDMDAFMKEAGINVVNMENDEDPDKRI